MELPSCLRGNFLTRTARLKLTFLPAEPRDSALRPEASELSDRVESARWTAALGMLLPLAPPPLGRVPCRLGLRWRSTVLCFQTWVKKG